MSKFLSGFKALVCASAALLCGGAWAAAANKQDESGTVPTYWLEFNGDFSSSGSQEIAFANSENNTSNIIEVGIDGRDKAMKVVSGSTHPYSADANTKYLGSGDFTLTMVAQTVRVSAVDKVPLVAIGNGNNFVGFYTEPNGNKVCFGSQTKVYLSAIVPTATLQYHSYVVTKSGSSLKLFVDGIEKDSCDEAPNCNVGGCQIGSVRANADGFTRQTGSFIDDVRIYQGAVLDQTKITAFANAYQVGPSLGADHTATISSNVNFTQASWDVAWTGASANSVTINVTADCTLTINEARTIGNLTFNVNSGKTLTLTGNNTMTVGTAKLIGGGTVKFTKANGFTPLGGSAPVLEVVDSIVELIANANWDYSGISLANIIGTGKIKLSEGNWQALPSSANMWATTLDVENNLAQNGLILTENNSTYNIANLSGNGKFRYDWGSSGTSRTLNIIQSKDTEWSGGLYNNDGRFTKVVVKGAPDATSKTLTYSGTNTTPKKGLEVDASGSLKFTGSWNVNGTLLVNGEFGGSGTISGATAVTVGNGAKIRADWSGNSGPVSLNVAPTMGASIDVVCESVPDSKKIKLFAGTITASSTTTLARVMTTDGESYDAQVSIESDGVYATVVDVPEDQAVAKIGDTFYLTLKVALDNAAKTAIESDPVTVTLLKATAENVTIPDYVSVETGFENKLTGTIAGSGTIRIVGEGTSSTSRAVPGISGLTNSANWTGTLEIANWHNETTIIKPSDYGNVNSTFVFNGFKGYIHYENAPYVFNAIEFKGDGFEGAGSYGAAPEISLKAKTISGNGSIKTGISCNNSNVGTFKLIGTESVNLTGALSATSRYRLVLTKDQSETLPTAAINTIVIGKDITIADAKKLTASNGLTGSGTVIYDAGNTNTAPTFTVANTWTGTVWLKNLRASNYSSNKNQALATPATLNNLGKANSVIKMTNCAGYVNEGNNDSTFPWTLELDGDSAWENLSGWSSRNRSYAGLIGEGVLDFFGMNSHCSEVERFADASEFRGRINVGDETGANYKGKRVIIGSDNLPTGDSGQILISSGKTVTVANGKTWTANAMYVNGIIKGSGTIASALTFNDGAMIDLTDNDSEVLKVADNKAVTFSGRVKVKGAALNDKVLSLGAGATLSASPTIILVDAEGVETDGYSLAKADNGDVTIVVAETVATVNGVAYPSFAQAITAAASGDVKTIVVSRNFTAYNETIPAGVVIDLNGHEVDGRLDLKGGAYVKDGSVVKIDGNTTSFDIVFNDPAHPDKIDYEEIDVTLQYDTTATFKTEDSKVLGVYTKHHPYINGLQNKTWFNDTDELTMAVVGVMPEFSETLKKRVFAHMGSSNDGLNGMFVSTGEKEDEVIICYNNAGTSHEITRMIVSNASTTPHSYVITKHDDPAGTPNRKATFTVYLDGQKRKTLAVNHFIISGGFQVGKPFGGGVSGFSGCSDNSSYISVLRIYDRAISLAEIQRYAEVYPYVSPNGSSARTFTESANWVGTGTEWTNTPKQGDPTHEAAPGIGAISATINAEATITMNLAEAKPAELLTVSGSGSVVFEKGEGDAKALTPADLTTSIPTTIKYGSLDISAANVTLLEGSSLTLDYTDYPVSDITAAKTIKVTGEIERDDDNVHLTPTHVPGYNFVLGYNTSLKQYEATISPDHTAGTKVYAANSSYASFVLEDDTTTILFPNDKIVISSKGFSADSGRWAVNLDDQKLDGHQIVVDYPNGGINPGITVSGNIRDGLNIEIAEGSIMYMRENKSIWTTTISGTGTYQPAGNTVCLHGALTITCPVEMSGNGNFCLESESTLTISEEASVKVTAYSGDQGFVKKTDNGDGTLTYSFEPGSEVITPSEDPDAPAVVIEDVGQGVKINPGADVIVPVGTDTSKIEVKYGDRVFNTGDDAIIDVVVNGTTGKIELSIKAEKEDEVRPTVTTMSAPTEESTDKVAFTITSPIPGLFYSVSSCDTPTGSFVDSTGDQATSDAAKTVSIPMNFGENQKVKYYRVSVKATK